MSLIRVNNRSRGLTSLHKSVCEGWSSCSAWSAHTTPAQRLRLLGKIFLQGLKIIIPFTGRHLPFHPLNYNERRWPHGNAVMLDQHPQPGKRRPLGQQSRWRGVEFKTRSPLNFLSGFKGLREKQRGLVEAARMSYFSRRGRRFMGSY